MLIYVPFVIPETPKEKFQISCALVSNESYWHSEKYGNEAWFFQIRNLSPHFLAKLKWQKNIQSISRLLLECPHSGLQNEPPLDSLDPQSPNPFMASPSPDPIQRLAIKGFRDWGSRLSSGGSFRSPGWGRSRSSLEIDWIFFCHFNFPESAVTHSRKWWTMKTASF